MRYCIFCGAEIPPSAAYCQICGKPQPDGTIAETAETAEPEETADKPKKILEKITASPKNIIIAGGCVFVALLLIFTIILMLVL